MNLKNCLVGIAAVFLMSCGRPPVDTSSPSDEVIPAGNERLKFHIVTRVESDAYLGMTDGKPTCLGMMLADEENWGNPGAHGYGLFLCEKFDEQSKTIAQRYVLWFPHDRQDVSHATDILAAGYDEVDRTGLFPRHATPSWYWEPLNVFQSGVKIRVGEIRIPSLIFWPQVKTYGPEWFSVYALCNGHRVFSNVTYGKTCDLSFDVTKEVFHVSLRTP